MSLVRDKLSSVFPDVQIGVGLPGGSECAVHVVQAVLEIATKEFKSDDVIVAKTDFKNAFNARNRAHIATSLYSHAQLNSLWRLFDFAYSAPSLLVVHKDGVLEGHLWSENGVRQGDSLASLCFALSLFRTSSPTPLRNYLE